MKLHITSSPKAILSDSISEIDEEVLVLDFDNFQEKSNENEMDMHLMVKKYGKSELLLHPILQAFLDLKWNQVKNYYFFNLFHNLFFHLSFEPMCFTVS